jgi:hypothetical protein
LRAAAANLWSNEAGLDSRLFLTATAVFRVVRATMTENYHVGDTLATLKIPWHTSRIRF